MKIRIFNAKILTMADDLSIINGELIINSEKIETITNYDASDYNENLPSSHFDREIDAKQNLVMPGFKNAHSHSPMTFARSLADDLPLAKWLNEKIFPMESKLSDDNIRIFTKIAFLEYLKSGITASFDMYFRPENIIDAAKDFGFRSVICGAVNDFVESVPKMENLYNQYNNACDSLISYKLGFHAEYTTNQSILKDIAALAQEKKAPVYCHNSETKSEVAGCIARHGMTPVAYLDSLGMFNYSGGGFHLVYVTPEDIKILKERNIHAITCPGSNCKLASGIAPLYRYIDAGINLAIGTDGPSSNNALDMFREMYLTTALQKIHTENASAMQPITVLNAATVNGAKAMGLDNCDILAPGKEADLIIIDLNQPNMQPINNIPKNIVYSGNPSNVVLTMIAGNILYEKGEYYVNEDIEKLYETSNKMLKKLV